MLVKASRSAPSGRSAYRAPDDVRAAMCPLQVERPDSGLNLDDGGDAAAWLVTAAPAQQHEGSLIARGVAPALSHERHLAAMNERGTRSMRFAAYSPPPQPSCARSFTTAGCATDAAL